MLGALVQRQKIMIQTTVQTNACSSDNFTNFVIVRGFDDGSGKARLPGDFVEVDKVLDSLVQGTREGGILTRYPWVYIKVCRIYLYNTIAGRLRHVGRLGARCATRSNRVWFFLLTCSVSLYMQLMVHFIRGCS